MEFLKGYLEDIPLPDASVDVVIFNCVINLAADKRTVLAEAARVLRPGGRFAVSDVIADPDMDAATRADMAAFTGCIAGLLTEQDFRAALAAAGLTDIEVRETHRVHEHASAAIVRARKPERRDGWTVTRLPPSPRSAGPSCCAPPAAAPLCLSTAERCRQPSGADSRACSAVARRGSQSSAAREDRQDRR